MINEEVADRLIENLQADNGVVHDQTIWLRDHKNLFVISEDNRWGCATSGCAAGHVFLQEGTEGMVFSDHDAMVYPDMHIAKLANYWELGLEEFDENVSDGQIYDAVEQGIDIAEWAGKILGIWEDELDSKELDIFEGIQAKSKVSFLFYNEETTEEIINRINFLRAHDDPRDYDWATKY